MTQTHTSPVTAVLQFHGPNGLALLCGGSGAGDDYTIDAAKKMKYEQLFPVEAKKFGYDPANAARNRTVEEALDDRVRKKADRYCK